MCQCHARHCSQLTNHRVLPPPMVKRPSSASTDLCDLGNGACLACRWPVREVRASKTGATAARRTAKAASRRPAPGRPAACTSSAQAAEAAAAASMGVTR